MPTIKHIFHTLPMKIDKIEICNLASLEGEQVIDFTQEPLKSAGLFAITGNTGTGKSTILDAICLALYNEAPRLGNREKNTASPTGEKTSIYSPCNMLRRGATQGYSKVTFSLGLKEQYQAVWVAGLTRNGTYRPIERQLIRLQPKRQVLSDTNTDTKVRIEQLIGLDFDQFTRTVILAQNGFSNFLSAKKSDKSQLLEKITGTELYAQISRSIYRHTQEARTAYDLAKEKMESLARKTLNDDDLRHTRNDLYLSQTKHHKLTEERERVGKQLEWFEQYDKAKADYDQKKAAAYEARQAYNTMYDKRIDLERYDKLQPLAPTYHSIEQVKQNIARIKSDVSTKELIRERYMSDVEQSSSKLNDARSRLLTANQILSLRQPEINRGRQIEGQLHTAAENLKNTQADLLEHSEKLRQQQDERQREADELANCQKRLAAARLMVQSMTQHRRMIPQIDYLRSRLQRMNELRQNSQKEQKKQEDSNRNLAHLKEREAQLNDEAHSLQEEIGRLNGELLIHNQANKGLTSGEIQARLNRLNDLALQSGAAITLWNRIDRRYTEIHDKRDELRRRRAQNDVLNGEIIQKKVRVEELVRRYDQAHNSFTLSQSSAITSLRDKLKEGEPCPLCGSAHHPFHTESPAQLDDLLNNLKEQDAQAQRDLEDARRSLAELEKQYNDEQGRLAGEDSLLERLKGEQQEDVEAWKQYEGLDPTFATCDESVNRLNRLTTLKKIHESSDKERKDVALLLQTFNKHQDEINRINALIQQTQQKITEISRQQARIVAGKQVEETKIANARDAIDDNTRKLTDETTNIDSIITVSDWRKQWEQSYETFDRALADIKFRWDENSQAVDKEEKNLLILQQHVDKFDGIVSNLNQERQNLQRKADIQQQQVDKCKEELRNIFGSGSADEEAARLNGDVERCSKDADVALENYHTAQEKLNSVNGEISSLNAQSDEMDANRRRLQTRLDEDISRFNMGGGSMLQYHDLERYFSHPEDWSTLRHKIDILRSEQEAAEYKMETAEAVVNDLNRSPFRPADNDVMETQSALKERSESLSTQIDDTMKEQQNLEYTLHVHEDSVRESEAFRPTLLKKQNDMEQWQELNRVLGSADGKAFREIAQCYTFDFLVEYANRQLADLTPRYKLRTHPGTLQLEVIDRYMLDQVRAVNSLSGGESFIVSLALALGLSSLSSNNLEIGSLFIDEGFGNLDNENLNMVIDALSNLQNTQRRKVGVISHTELIQSRISPKICLVPKPGGRSVIEVRG